AGRWEGAARCASSQPSPGASARPSPTSRCPSTEAGWNSCAPRRPERAPPTGTRWVSNASPPHDPRRRPPRTAHRPLHHHPPRGDATAQKNVLLTDEEDKADPAFEAFLLEVLSDFQVSVPELGTIRARHPPVVVLTSNRTRELSEALVRRCLHLYVDFPGPEKEAEIIALKVPELDEKLRAQVARFVAGLRKLELRKAPSIAETLDWARGLCALGVRELDPATVRQTLALVVKHEEDLRKAEGKVSVLLAGR